MTGNPTIQRTTRPVSAIVILVIGAVLTIFGPIAGLLIGSFALVPSALNYAEGTVTLRPEAVVEFETEQTLLLLAPVADLGQISYADCRATSTDGVSARVESAPATELNTNAGLTRYESFARITAAESGSYTLTCDSAVDVIAAPPFQAGSFLGPLAWGTGGGLLISLAGIVLAIVGIVRLARANQPSRA